MAQIAPPLGENRMAGLDSTQTGIHNGGCYAERGGSLGASVALSLHTHASDEAPSVLAKAMGGSRLTLGARLGSCSTLRAWLWDCHAKEKLFQGRNAPLALLACLPV